MLRQGQTAPEFTLPGAQGDNIDTHGLAEYTDNGWTTVLAFYPLDFHPDCTDRLCALRDVDWLTVEDSVAVLGIGADGVYSHQRFAAENRIDFPLLSDADGRVAAAYGVGTDTFDGHRGVPKTALFVVDPYRVVQYAWNADGPDDSPDIDAARKATNCRDGSCARPDDTPG